MYSPNTGPQPDGPSFQELKGPELEASGIESPEAVQATELTPEDIHRLSRIYKECFEALPWNETWSMSEANAQIQRYIDSGADLIIVRNRGAVVGMVVGMSLENYQQKSASDGAELAQYKDGKNPYYLADFSVDSIMQGSGIGSTLVKSLVDFARCAGYDSVLTRTRVDNISALRVFTRNGFMSKGVYSATTGGVESDRTVLSRRIS